MPIYNCSPSEHRRSGGGRRACYDAVAARRQTLRLAIASLGTWRQHVHHMEMLRRAK